MNGPSQRIYLDHNALSPLRPEVSEVLRRYASDPLFNPSSVHGSGRVTRRVLDDAREAVAAFLGASPWEILFTSSGTESVHLAWNAFARPGSKIATTTVEHACALAAAKNAENLGAHVSRVSVNGEGALNEVELRQKIAEPVDFLSLQHANNETGVILPIERWFHEARVKRIVTHTDAVQSAGKWSVDVHELGVDLLSVSGHKLGALSGVGALYVRKGTPFESIWGGGPQERGRRGGTENVLGILSLAEACRVVKEQGEAEVRRIGNLRDTFERELLNSVPGSRITAAGTKRLCNTSHVTFEQADGESLLIAADLAGLHCSTGAACSSGSLRPSHVLLAMGMSEANARNSLRFSFGWNTTEKDIAQALEILPRLVTQVREGGRSIRRERSA